MKYFIPLLLLLAYSVKAQGIVKDTIKTKEIKEIIVIGRKAQLFERQGKLLSSLDEYLQQSAKVDMIKRGSYAWEPIINGMATERTLITIDGMRIFGACTDKMDPITSYVEVSNLSEATIASGQEGACFGNTIGGSIDLKRNRSQFGEKKWDFNVNSGFETNNRQKIIGASVNYADSLFYADTDVMLRDADNYKAGNSNEMPFSQFRKINLSTTLGYKIGSNKLIEGSVIYDKATNVGYPALPMDVSLAEALISSFKLQYAPYNSVIRDWETKVYFNTITHRMDDTQRPMVAIHMDMPGWSKTYGYYSKIRAQIKRHDLTFNNNAFYNQSLAEMTMYPSNAEESPMFMYTWPDIRTFYEGLFLEDNYTLNCHSGIKFSATIGFHSNTIASRSGFESLQIFYPEMSSQKQRFLKGFALNYNYNKTGWEYGIGSGYGERAPSVSEGYGFYLFNSFDGYDHIGNPGLKNEKSLEWNGYLGYKKRKMAIKMTGSYFHIYNYIIAIPNAALLPMTIGANGVKVYSSVNFATIMNTSLLTEYQFSKKLKWNSQLVFSRGTDCNNKNLPFISPLSYTSSLHYSKDKISAEIGVQGNGTQTNYNKSYGEDKTPAYVIINASFGYKFLWNTIKIQIKTGIENVMDKEYSTYSDWNNLPRMGRNVFVNLACRF